MPGFTSTINYILSIGTILLQFLSLILIIGLFSKDKSAFFKFFGQNALKIITILAFISMGSSLLYSEVIKYPPCTLCWYQRIFMYSIAFFGLTALIKKFKTEVFSYIKIFSVVGFIIALYHSTIRFIGSEPIPCSASGPSCLQELFLQFGYIDIPMMSLTGFVFILLILQTRKRFIA